MNRISTILIIEDNPERQERLLSWLPPGTRPILAQTGGKAAGLLKRGETAEYAGIVLDHDLDEQMITNEDLLMNGSKIVNLIITNVERWVPILIQSMNPRRGPGMAAKLRQAGFTVDFVPMTQLTAERLHKWTGEAHQLWQDMQEE